MSANLIDAALAAIPACGTVNWTTTSELLLIELVKPRIQQVEGTGNSSSLNKDRIEAWKSITAALEAQTGIAHLTAVKTKRKFQSMKSIAKQKQLVIRQHFHQTGGGGSCEVLLTQVDERIIEMFGEQQGFVGVPGATSSNIMAGATPPTAQRPPRPVSAEELQNYILARDDYDGEGNLALVDEDDLAARMHVFGAPVASGTSAGVTAAVGGSTRPAVVGGASAAAAAPAAAAVGYTTPGMAPAPAPAPVGLTTTGTRPAAALGPVGPTTTGRRRRVPVADAQLSVLEHQQDLCARKVRIYEKFEAVMDILYLKLTTPPSTPITRDTASGSDSADHEVLTVAAAVAIAAMALPWCVTAREYGCRFVRSTRFARTRTAK
eukprot:GHVU01088086.1.p1 GENE.GHVU01088086.1~~GHVU01088086.1.p1  ORF type:complete len:378 (+),score=43.88 GHVU01088086.1:175-1308(+)